MPSSDIKRFEERELREAIAFAKEGGQALHVHSLNQNGHRLFRRYPKIAHLFDQDRVRLVATARELGVRVIVVDHPGTDKQHIDLCGKPFNLALSACAPMDEHGQAQMSMDIDG